MKISKCAAKIAELSQKLNEMDGINVWMAIHGNTGCICVEVSENKTEVYENRAFMDKKCEEHLAEIALDLKKMLKHARRCKK